VNRRKKARRKKGKNRLMPVPYYSESLDELERIGVLLSFQRVERFSFDASPVLVAYDASNIVSITYATTSTVSVSATKPQPVRGLRSGEAHRRVVEQTRRADEYAAQNTYRDESVDEDHFRYPQDRNIDTRGIHRLRRRA